MIDPILEALTRKVAILAKQKFEMNGGLFPYFYGEVDEGRRFIFDPVGLGLIPKHAELDERVKELISEAAQMLFAVYKVKHYVYASEAWMLTADRGTTEKEKAEIEKILETGRIAHHPKRIEVIAFYAEDINNNYVTGHQSVIRPAGERPYLDDDLTLEGGQGAIGRFTHLLDFRKFVNGKIGEK